MGVSPQDQYPSGAPASDRDASMIRREEELRVRTVSQTTGRVTLRKRIVEEEQTFSVVVQREEAEVVEEGATEPASASTPPVERSGRAAPATDGADSDSGEIVLFEQRPVVTLEWVPVERVRLERTVVRGEETVTGEVRREVVEEVAEDANADDAAGVRPEHR